LKDAVFNAVFLVEFAYLGDEGVVEFFAFEGRRGFVKIRFVALLCGGEEGELRYWRYVKKVMSMCL
jgi:hypothetical protein